MNHLGDITKIHGCTAPVVDVVIGGSPCQDLSIAGNRGVPDGGNEKTVCLDHFRGPTKMMVNRLKIDAFKSPGQPGREGDNNERNQIEALPVLRWCSHSQGHQGRLG